MQQNQHTNSFDGKDAIQFKKSMLRWWLLLLSVFIIHNLEEILFDIYAWEMTHRLPGWYEGARKFHTYIQLTP